MVVEDTYLTFMFLQAIFSEPFSRIGKNPTALDDLIKETASKMASCPFLLPEPVSIPERIADSWRCVVNATLSIGQLPEILF